MKKNSYIAKNHHKTKNIFHQKFNNPWENKRRDIYQHLTRRNHRKGIKSLMLGEKNLGMKNMS